MPSLKLIISKFSLTFFLCLTLSGCSTVGGWFGGGEDEMAAEPVMEAPEVTEPAGPTPDELLAQKDQALIEQGMRIANAERELQMLQEENSAIKMELEETRKEAEENQKMLDMANESQVSTAAENAGDNSDMPRVTAPDGGYGLHLASYELRDSIQPGINALTRQIPVLIQGRPIKIAQATVRGRNYNRLVVGQFDSQSDALAECRQALLLISFCEVVAFQGEDF